MAFTAMPISEFGGLDLREPEQVGATRAIDILNVDLDRKGAIRTRDGLAKFNAVAGAANLTYAKVWRTPPTAAFGDVVIASDAGSDLRAYAPDGVLIATLATTHPFVSVAGLGTGAAGPYAYVGGYESGQIRRFDGTAWASPAGMPNARFVAVQPIENRLAAAYTLTTQKSRVQFSDAGAPETWTAANFVDLFPNDGENITAMVAFGTQLFVFKQSRFFVFYGNSVASDGSSVFNYRVIDTGVGVTPRDGAVAANDGVYFMHQTGFYRTTGGAPEKISGNLDAIFSDYKVPPFTTVLGTSFDLHSGDGSPASPVVFGSRVVFPTSAFALGASPTSLVYYRDTGEWSVWSSAIGGTMRPQAALVSNSSPVLLWADVGGANSRMFITDRTVTTDDGTNISSLYRSGFYTVGNQPTQEAVIQETMIEGTGAPIFAISKDYGTIPTSGGGAEATLTLGTAPAYDNTWHTADLQGRRFSYQLRRSAGPVWKVNSITHHIKAIRAPGVEST